MGKEKERVFDKYKLNEKSKFKSKKGSSKEQDDEIALLIIANILKDNKKIRKILESKPKKKKELSEKKESLLEEIAKTVKKINSESLGVYVIDMGKKDKSILYMADKLSYKNTSDVYGVSNPYSSESKTVVYDLDRERDSIKATQVGADVINERAKKADNSYKDVVEVSNLTNEEAEIVLSDYLKDAVLGQGMRVRADVKESLQSWLLFQDPNGSMKRFYETQATFRTRDVNYSRPM